jgi:hypothetical protein
MDRRDFVAASIGASVTALSPAREAGAGGADATAGTPQVFELRRVQLRLGPMETRYAEYAKGALVPALNRAGVKPVGAFTTLVGPDTPAVTLLLPHPNADSVVALNRKMAADPEYQKAAAAFRALPATDPPYVRRESRLMVAFDSMPAIEAPTGASAAASRVFELRVYESHNDAASAKKVEMFEKGGEIAIFRRLGLSPVFFARNLVGPRLPSLTYMLVFADLAAREKAWTAFRADPEWEKLRTTPGLGNADIMTGITNLFLRPTDYSQI